MAKLINGVGFNDATYKTHVLDNGKLVMCPFYKTWQSMLARCYSKSYQAKKPTYVGCTVCDEWLVFSNFRAWMQNQDWQGKQLDKDLLFQDNKIYSPNTCVFVTHITNSFVKDNKASRGDTMLGVNYHITKKVYQSRCSNPFTKKSDYLGYFDNDLDAHLAWKKRKFELAVILAEPQTDERVKQALLTRYA